jgi:hypothetical protein
MTLCCNADVLKNLSIVTGERERGGGEGRFYLKMLSVVKIM